MAYGETMSNLVPVRREESPRWRSVRDVAVFHLKLFFGGLVSTICLSPLSLLAAGLDFLSGSRERRSFDAVLRLGKSLEQWINLYGTLSERGESRGTLDDHLQKLEDAAIQSRGPRARARARDNR
jgi:hypothetical protein